MENKIKTKTIIRTIVTILLFIFMKYFQYIPVLLFKLDVEALTMPQIYMLSIFSYVLVDLIIFFMYRKDLKENFKRFKENFWENADLAMKCWFVGLGVMIIVNLAIMIFTPSKGANNEQKVDEIIKAVPVLAFFLTTVFAPFTEEMTFRKAFYDVLKNNKILYILVSGIVFGAMHVVFNITSVYDYLYIIPYSALGISFAYMDMKSDNIFPSIIIHTIHNGVLTLLQIFLM